LYVWRTIVLDMCFTLLKTGQNIGISGIVKSLKTVRAGIGDSDQRPKIMEEKYGRGINRSNLAHLVLIFIVNVANNHGATFGEDLVPEFGDPPCDGEDDAFSDQDTKHISRNLPTILIRVEELVRVKVLACVSDIRQPDV